MRKLIYIIILFCILSITIGCKTQYVPVETIKKETEYKDRWRRDSIYMHDSIFVKQKGDTIWLERYKTLYKEKLVRDSIFITDSIKVDVPYPVVETKEVNRLKNWQIILMVLGGVAIGYIGFRVIRFFK